MFPVEMIFSDPAPLIGSAVKCPDWSCVPWIVQFGGMSSSASNEPSQRRGPYGFPKGRLERQRKA